MHVLPNDRRVCRFEGICIFALIFVDYFPVSWQSEWTGLDGLHFEPLVWATSAFRPICIVSIGLRPVHVIGALLFWSTMY